MQKWEYLTVHAELSATHVNSITENGEYRDDSFSGTALSFFKDYLNSLGEKGWELVSVAGGHATFVYTFKRPKG